VGGWREGGKELEKLEVCHWLRIHRVGYNEASTRSHRQNTYAPMVGNLNRTTLEGV
jgi:hypothetical protein